MELLNCWVLKPGCVLAHYFVNWSTALCGHESNWNAESMRDAAVPEDGSTRKCPKCAAKLRAEARRQGRDS